MREDAPVFIEIGAVGAVTSLVLNRPDKRNALTEGMLRELLGQLGALAERPQVRVVLLAGNGSSFCSGDDVSDPQLFSPNMDHRKSLLTELHHQIVRSLLLAPYITVAALQGYSVGFGVDLALSADLRVVGKDAILRDGRITSGVASGTGLLWLLPLLVGGGRAREFFIRGVDWDWNVLQSIGLADLVVEPEEVREEAVQLATQLGDSPPTVARGRQAFWRSFGRDIDTGFSPSLDVL